MSILYKLAKEFNLSPDALWEEAWGLFCQGIRVDIQEEIKTQLEPYGAMTSAGLHETIKAIDVAFTIEHLERVTEMIDLKALSLEYWCKLSGSSRGEMLKGCLLLFMKARLARCNERIKEVLAKYNEENLASFENSIAENRHGEHPAWEDLISLENLTEDKEDIQKLIDVMHGTDPKDCE